MVSLRIYFNSAIKKKIEDIRNQISANREVKANFKDQQIVRSGFYKKILELVSDDYYISDYFEIGEKSIPTFQTELAYFNYLESSTESEIKQHPILIKLIYNPKKNIICFFTRAKMSDEMSNNLIQTLHKKYHFNYIYNPEIYRYREEMLNNLVNAFEIKDFRLITVWDSTNRVSIKNPSGPITETKKYIELIKEQQGGNWTHLIIPFEGLKISLKISKIPKNFITFENDYIDDYHLVKAVDFLINKITEIENFSGAKQTLMDTFC